MKRLSHGGFASRLSERQLELAVALGLLLVALFAVLSLPLTGMQPTQLIQWYYHYDHGFVQRAFLEAMVRLFFGEPTIDELNQTIPHVGRWVTVLNIIILWFLLTPRIVTVSAFSSAARWLLMAFVAILLLAPVWKSFVVYVGFADKWFYLPVLLATAALVLRRPLLFAVLLIIPMLIHRGGVFFSVPLALMAFHAAWRIPAFQRRRRSFCGICFIRMVARPRIIHAYPIGIQRRFLF